MRLAPYSYSRISTYKSCPRKFKYTYIDKLSGTGTSLALQKGSYLHHCLEHYPSKPHLFYNLEEENIKQYNEIIFNFISTPLGDSIVNAPITIGKELDFGLDIKMEPCNFNSTDAFLRGSIDRLNYNAKENILEVYDYKSGKAREHRFQDFDQVFMYCIWIFRNPLFNNMDKVKTSYVYIEHGIENVLITERKYLKNYLENYINSIKTLENDNEYQKCETKLCEYCDFKAVGICT